MKYFVYLIFSKYKNKIISYVGYTKNINKRMNLHNSSKGAKFTKGRKWILFYKENFHIKSKAMSREYELKKNRKFRGYLKEKFMRINKNFIS